MGDGKEDKKIRQGGASGRGIRAGGRPDVPMARFNPDNKTLAQHDQRIAAAEVALDHANQARHDLQPGDPQFEHVTLTMQHARQRLAVAEADRMTSQANPAWQQTSHDLQRLNLQDRADHFAHRASTLPQGSAAQHAAQAAADRYNTRLNEHLNARTAPPTAATARPARAGLGGPNNDGVMAPITPDKLGADGLMKSTTPPPRGVAFTQSYSAHSTANPGATTAFKELFGQTVTSGEAIKKLGKLVGAPDGSQVRLVGGGDQIKVYIEHSALGGSMERTISKDQGQVKISNDYFRLGQGVPANAVARGTGVAIFGRQVAEARRMGVSRIEVHGVGDVHSTAWNGYYTWPRFGYDGPIEHEYRRAMPADLAGAHTYQELFAKPGGAAWWHEHGGDIYGTFDLHPNSVSSKALRNYAHTNKIQIKGV